MASMQRPPGGDENAAPQNTAHSPPISREKSNLLLPHTEKSCMQNQMLEND